MKDFWSPLWKHRFKVSERQTPILPFSKKLGFGLIRNHAFIDGNKRIGTHAMLVFLSLNGIELTYTQSELSNLILAVAAGTQSFDDMVKWVIEHQE